MQADPPSNVRQPATAGRATGWTLFLVAWIAFSFFHQGGGWNQNIRFAMVRAMVEEGRFGVDSFLFYSSIEQTEHGPRMVRTPLVEGSFTFRGNEYDVAWHSASGERVAVGEVPEDPDDNPNMVDLSRVASSADVAYARGSFHPNKAPGTTFLAVPAYFLIYNVERLLGVNPDDWWVLTVNAWLSSALSVGLVSALGCLVFFRLALMLSGGRALAAVLATMAFAFGTIFFPYATMLYEHNVVAVALLTAFWLLERARQRAHDGTERLDLILAGLAAGYAAISNYLAAVVVLFFLAYLFYRTRRPQAWLWLGLGLLGPFLLVCFYNQACFGMPFTTNYHFQNPNFRNDTGFLSVLERPHLDRLVMLLFSPFRGLFFISPILLLGVAGLVRMWRTRERRPEAVLFVAILGFYLLFNISFNGWHGGWGVGPRYLAPAVPFLALPAVYGFVRYFRTATALAVISVAVMSLLTIVDPQAPVGVASIARISGRPSWTRNAVADYALPIFLTGSATPIIASQLEAQVRREEKRLSVEGVAPEQLETQVQAFRERLEELRAKGEPPVGIIYWKGPVSANPIGVYESWVGRGFPPDSEQSAWNSFNAGELLLPRGRPSLLLLLVLSVPLAASTILSARDRDRQRTGSSLGMGLPQSHAKT